MNLQEFLRKRRVPYVTLRHGTTFSAQHMAHALHVPGDHVAKTVLLRADDSFVLAVLQATHAIDMHLARTALSAEHVSLAPESDLAEVFTDCDLGVVPPFGSGYGIKTLVDESLTHDECIAFEGNSHDETLCVRYQDYAKIEHPQVAAISRHV
jgi:Ala-tRNA(Pro) deacylase